MMYCIKNQIHHVQIGVRGDNTIGENHIQDSHVCARTELDWLGSWRLLITEMLPPYITINFFFVIESHVSKKKKSRIIWLRFLQIVHHKNSRA